MNPLDSWIAAVRRELDIDSAIDRDLLLDATREVAHAVARPAAPLTAYLMGVAIGRGADADEVARRVNLLAKNWVSEVSPDS